MRMKPTTQKHLSAICGKTFTEKDIRVRDHCHVTGNYRGPAHQDCNLKLRINAKELKIPVVFHNLRGYDSHLIMQNVGNIAGEHKLEINCIPNNMEKYMSIILGKHLVFIDSYQFMFDSLEELANNLPEDAFKYTSQVFQGKQVKLMTKKGVYPYDYMNSTEKFNDRQLPSKDSLYSLLTDQSINDDSYEHA